MGRQSQVMITVAQAATLLDLSETWVRKLMDEGAIPNPTDGKIPLVETVQGYIRWLRDDERRVSKSAAASRVQDARAHEIEVRTQERIGKLVAKAREEAMATVDEAAGMLKPNIMGVPPGYITDLKLRRAVEVALEECFGEMARKLRAFRGTADSGR
jgi:hypothetical protein